MSYGLGVLSEISCDSKKSDECLFYNKYSTPCCARQFVTIDLLLSSLGYQQRLLAD